MKSVKIERCDGLHEMGVKEEQNLTGYGYDVHIDGLKAALQFLRCFGSSITDLTICYNQLKSKRYNHVQQYINNYCTDSLVRLSFKEMPNIAIATFQKQFNNVRELNVRDSRLGQQFSTFLNCFPNLNRLILREVHMQYEVLLMDRSCICIIYALKTVIWHH